MKLNNETGKTLVKGNVLNAQNQQVTKIEALSELSNITRLDLTNNILRTSDSLQGLSVLSNFTWLNLSHNGLASFHLSSILPKLQVLNISNNKLKELPDLSQFTNLKAVIANNNEITKIPAQHLPLSINTLVLSHNQIELLPDLSACKNLVKLSLSHNLVKEFPRKLPEALAELRMNGNKLVQTSSIPSKVNLLDLGNNEFTSLQDLQPLLGGNGSMKCLKNLSLKGNKLKGFEEKVLLEWFPRLALLDNKPFALQQGNKNNNKKQQ